MKVYFDNNHFVRMAVSDETITDIPNGWMESTVENIPENYFDIEFGLPLYKHDEVTNTCVPVTDPITQYAVDPIFSMAYRNKLYSRTMEEVKTLTLDELKALYNNSPAYKQEAIYNCIEVKWAEMMPQYRLNLGIEMMIRAFAEYQYVKYVEQREPTVDEQTAFNNILTMLHNHGTLLQLPPLSPTGWYIQYLELMMQDSDYLRQNCIPERFFVTGR